MKMTKKERKIFDEHFGIYDDEELSIEQWTNGGVDMFITFDRESKKTITEQFEDYIDNFDIDEEIDLYRQDSNYKENFTINESLEDFQRWLEYCKSILEELKGVN